MNSIITGETGVQGSKTVKASLISPKADQNFSILNNNDKNKDSDDNIDRISKSEKKRFCRRITKIFGKFCMINNQNFYKQILHFYITNSYKLSQMIGSRSNVY